MPDSLSPQDFRKVLVRQILRIRRADGQDNIQPPKCFEPSRLVLIGQEVARIVKVNGLVVIAVHVGSNVSQTAETEDARDAFGMAKAEIQRLVATQIRSG